MPSVRKGKMHREAVVAKSTLRKGVDIVPNGTSIG